MSQVPTGQSPVPGFFHEIQETLRLKFRGWEADLPHQGEKGGIRERRVKDSLRTILPAKYGMGSGHIIDSQGQTSLQSDIVIYDAYEGLALPVDDYYSLFPCECVYAVIEVKSELNASDGDKSPSGTIYECLKANTILKSLDRARHDLLPIHYIVFCYFTEWETVQADNVKRWFETLGQKYNMNLPEMVFILDPCFVLGTSGPSGYNDQNRFTNIYEKEPLLYFISDLVYRLSVTKVTTPDLWNEYNKWLLGDVMARIYKDTDGENQ
jgi:hypothetical protein